MIQIESTHGHEANRLTKQFAQAHPVKNMKSVDHFACHAWKLQVLQPQNKHSLRIATVFVSSDNIMGFNIHIYIYMRIILTNIHIIYHISIYPVFWRSGRTEKNNLHSCQRSTVDGNCHEGTTAMTTTIHQY